MKTTGEEQTLPIIEPAPSGSSSLSAAPPTLDSPCEPASGSETTLDLVGTTIGNRYKVLSRLGKGGMSEVFKAEHIVLQKPFALKLLRSQEASCQSSIERFQQEGKAISALDHPNIVKVFAFGVSDNSRLYLAMEYLDGRNLAEILEAEGPLSWQRALSVALQIVDGLRQAHSRGIIHRDLKPSNIIVQTEANGVETAKIVDFGVARLTGNSGKTIKQLTLEGSTCGSPAYMSPEQCFGRLIDERSDIYSTGCLLYELLSGRRPFYADTTLALMQQQVEQAPELFQILCPNITIPPSLEAIIRKCMAKNPESRYQSMSDLQNALKLVGSDSPAEKKMEEALFQDVPALNTSMSKLENRAKLALICAGSGVLIAAAAFACFQFSCPGEITRLSNEIRTIPAGDPDRIEKNFSLATRLLTAYSQAASRHAAGRGDRQTVMLRLRELQARVNELPLSFSRCFYQSRLVRFYTGMGSADEAKKLSGAILKELERLMSSRTAPHPDNRMVETALLEALRICRDDRSDHIVGNYNILLSMYMAEGKLPEAEQAGRTALAIAQALKPRRPLSEISVKLNLSSVLIREGRFTEAEVLRLESWQLCKKTWEPQSPFYRNVGAALAECYRAEGKLEPAAQINEEISQAKTH